MEGFARNFLNLEALQRSLGVLAEGAGNTLILGLVSLTLALVIGVPLAIARLSPVGPLRSASVLYVDVMRALPRLVAIVLAFYLLPPLTGLRIEPFGAAAITFGMMHGAYFSEVYRGAWSAIDRGQFDAAQSLGLRMGATVRLVALPQVLRILIPPATNQITLLMRDLPLAFFIGYFEILNAAKAAQVFTSNSTPLLAVVVFYAITLLSLQQVASRVENWSRRRSEV